MKDPSVPCTQLCGFSAQGQTCVFPQPPPPTESEAHSGHRIIFLKREESLKTKASFKKKKIIIVLSCLYNINSSQSVFKFLTVSETVSIVLKQGLHVKHHPSPDSVTHLFFMRIFGEEIDLFFQQSSCC